MLDAIWSVISNVKNGNTTRMWRLFVFAALFVAYTSGICFATWVFTDARDIRLTYVSKIDHDKRCCRVEDNFKTIMNQLREDINALTAAHHSLRELLLDKFMPGTTSRRETDEPNK